MRAKHLWRHCNIPAKASLVWSRITFSRLTTSYFIVAVLLCFVQVIIQGQAFSVNAAAAASLWGQVQHMNETSEAGGFAILNGDLRICYSVPNTMSSDLCTVIWSDNNQSSPSRGMEAASFSASVSSTPALVTTDSLPGATPAANDSPKPTTSVATSALSIVAPAANLKSVSSSSASPASRTSATTASPKPSSFSQESLPSSATVTVLNPISTQKIAEGDSSDDDSKGLSRRSDSQLSLTCVKTLIWPVQRLHDTKREDVTLIGFQVWVLALVTQLLITIWSIIQIFQTEQFRLSFARLVTHGACGMNILGGYWQQRKTAEITSAVINGLGLLVTAVLTYKLMKTYGWQTFKRVGASLTINRIYRVVLSLSIAIQLALFFIVSAAALWIDQLYNGAVGRMATLGTLYKGGIVLMFCLLIPWLSLGWFSVRREARTMSILFLVLSLSFIALWAAMFKSTSFRWTFVIWPFFTFMAVASGALMIITFILGLVCRFNFGKGLPRYLNAEEPLDGDDFVPVFPEKWGLNDDDPEKVDFPSSNGHPVPTFAATFGKGPELPKPIHVQFGHLRGGSVTRSVSSSSTIYTMDGHLTRSGSNGSEISHHSNSSTSSCRTDMGKRWVIE